QEVRGIMRVALYARFSSDNQKAASIDDQFRNCESYAQRQDDWTITHRYEDRAISGSQNAAGRPGYKQMLADAQARLFDILLVDDLSRLTRDEAELINARKRLVFWGVRFIAISDGFDTDQKGHKMLSGFKGIMNEVFLDDLRDKTKRGMIGQVLKGRHGGGRCFGYRLVPEYDSANKDPYGQPARIGTRLEIDPEQARWVRWIFESYADDMSPMKIVEELNRQGIASPGMAYRRKSVRPPSWCASALYGNVKFGLGMLNNRLYIGELTWGRSRWEKDPDTKKKRRFLCEEQHWIRQPAEHLRIVSDKIWARVKQRQATIHEASAEIRTALHVNARTGRGPKYLFSGLLTCAQCGHKFVILDPTRYGCSGWKYRGLSVCSNTVMAPRKLLEGILLDAIKDELYTKDGQAVFAQEVARLMAECRRAHKPDLKQAATRLKAVEQEIQHIMTAIKAGILTMSTKMELEKAEAERTRLLQIVQGQYKTTEKVTAFLPNAIGRLKGLIEDLGNVTQLQVDKARCLLRELVGEEIPLHPTADGVERYLTAEVRGDYEGLLRLATGQNKSGGGQGS
ncbi:MAG: recombinase family protein, partial [Nitrospiraceae bacterium]